MLKGKRIKIGIVGCGTIGSQLVKAVEKDFSQKAIVVALCDKDQQKAQQLKSNSRSSPRIVSLKQLLGLSDLIIEAASAEISYSIAEQALNLGKDVMVMSAAGILAQANQLFALARTKAKQIYLPSGAIAGLDAVKAAALAKINRVTLISRKPPQGLTGAPYLIQKGIDLTKVKKETEVFSGPVSEAVRGFPKNVNVCATLSLAAVGAKEIRVKIITSPDYKANIHEILLEGEFGRLLARTENVSTPGNPKTSFLACLSAVATLKGILDVVKIGT